MQRPPSLFESLLSLCENIYITKGTQNYVKWTSATIKGYSTQKYPSQICKRYAICSILCLDYL